MSHGLRTFAYEGSLTILKAITGGAAELQVLETYHHRQSCTPEGTISQLASSEISWHALTLCTVHAGRRRCRAWQVGSGQCWAPASASPARCSSSGCRCAAHHTIAVLVTLAYCVLSNKAACNSSHAAERQEACLFNKGKLK